jgi:hypothetical protein
MGSKSAILKTLLYSDIFNYPLTKTEIWRYLISNKKTSISDTESTLNKIKTINFKNGLYFLRGREKLVNLRQEKEKISAKKLKKAQKIIQKLFLISTIRFIGISGNLALKNAEDKDDIDLFIITKKNTIWLTRLLVILVLNFLGVYRKRGDKNVRDKICTNMFLDEGALSFSRKRKNIFTAHEIAQLRPILGKKDTYEKLIGANKWIMDYLPNSFNALSNKIFENNKSQTKSNMFLTIVNHIVKFPQLLYMKKHKTKEEISDSILAFHPQSHKNYVLKRYRERLQKHNL